MDQQKLGVAEFKVDDNLVTLDLDRDLDVDDIDDGMRKAAALIAYWGAVYAAAVRQEGMVTADYRNWKAQFAAAAVLDDPKMAQWKIGVGVEASDKFREFKRAQADAARNVESLRWVVEAFRSRASLLQSRGAMDRAALEATGMTTRERPFRTETEKTVAEEKKKDVVRGAIQKTRSSG